MKYLTFKSTKEIVIKDGNFETLGIGYNITIPAILGLYEIQVKDIPKGSDKRLYTYCINIDTNMIRLIDMKNKASGYHLLSHTTIFSEEKE